MSKRGFEMEMPAAFNQFGGATAFGQLNGADTTSGLISAAKEGNIQRLPRKMLVPLECNDEVYDVDDLDATAKDFAVAGIQEPLIVFRREDGRYSILAGNRRYAANELAIKQYPDYNGEYLPCIEQDPPKSPQELRKRMIKNNLQRDKSGYTKMMEIAVYNRSVEEEQSQQEGPTNIRQVVCEDLGVTQSEVTRYLKIFNSLIPELKAQFRAKKLSTNIAHKLARESEERQRFVLSAWPFETPLTDAELNGIFAAKAMREHMEQKAQAETNEKKPSASRTYQVTSVHHGLSMLAQNCASLSSLVSDDTEFSGSKKEEKRIIKRIEAEMAKIDSLREELEAIRRKESQ